MAVKESFLKSFGLYFLGNVLSKMAMFVLLPIYTEYLTPDQLGYYDVANTYLNLVVTFLFVDIYVGIMRFLFDYKESDQPYKPIANGLLIFCFSLLIYSIISLLIGLFFDIKFLWYIYIYGIGLVCNNLFGYLSRALGLNTLFALSGVVGTLVTGLISILGLIYVDGSISILYIAGISGFTMQILMILSKIKLHRYLSIHYLNKNLLRSLFLFSIPLSMNSLAYWLLTGYSNVIISAMLGLEENGLYMVALKFSFIINLLSNCFNLAWQEIAFRKGNEDKKSLSLFYSGAMNLLIGFMGFGSLALMISAWIVFPYMVSNSFYYAKYLIPLCIIAAVLNVVSGFMGQIYAALKQTKLIMYPTLVASAINIIIVPLFVQWFDLLGATVGVVISYLVNVLMRIYFIKRSVYIQVDKRILIRLLLLLSISLYVYYRCDLLLNVIMLCVISAFMLFSYKNMFLSLIKK